MSHFLLTEGESSDDSSELSDAENTETSAPGLSTQVQSVIVARLGRNLRVERKLFSSNKYPRSKKLKVIVPQLILKRSTVFHKP